MAKKNVKIGLKSAGAEPAAGDVNISYKGVRIAGLSESTSATLETENTIVEDDIEVEYNKPSTPPVGIPITWNIDETINPIISILLGSGIVLDANDNICVAENAADSARIIPAIEGTGYLITINVKPTDSTDSLNVSINSTPVAYNGTTKAYRTNYAFDEYSTGSITLSVSPKV